MNLTRRAPLCALLATTLIATVSAHVDIDSPTGGEMLVAGTTVTIEWHVAISHNLQNWDLWYSTTGASGPWIPIATDLPAGDPSVGVPHLFDWLVPDTPSSQVRIRIRQDNAGMDYEDISGGDSTIVGAGVAYCFGDGGLTDCPCVNNGAAQSGCENSFGTGGAILGGAGVPSITADSLVLSVTGTPPSATGLYFQGRERVNFGIGLPFGDGLRCVGGAIVRLGSKNAVAGSSSYPEPGDRSISVQGSVSAGGGPRHYQLWYRNTESFCTPEAFNLSNGFSVVWSP